MRRLVVVSVHDGLRCAATETILALPWASSLEVQSASRGDGVGLARLAFKVRATHVGATLKALKEVLGAKGTVDVMDVRVSTEALPPSRSTRTCCRSIADRLSTLEIHESISSASHLHSDHVSCVVLASFIASIGLLSDGSSVVLAAFFISPLMTMLLGLTWGCCVSDGPLARRSLRNLVVDAVLCFAIGLLVGGVLGQSMPHDPVALVTPPNSEDDNKGVWSPLSVSSSEILNRGPPASNIVLAACVAAFSGIAVALGHTGGMLSVFAGVALSTSLLPPLVNAGLMVGLAATYPRVKTTRGDRLVKVAYYSAAIYLVNIIAVFLFCYVTLRLKRVGGRTLRAAQRDFSMTTTSMTEAAADDEGDGGVAPTRGDVVLGEPPQQVLEYRALEEDSDSDSDSDSDNEGVC
ncbi:hypothetical protein CTAYLR_001150 [Chrysophaeum taylorii]|uniref:Uncharacterized protein n=1 Tax=Chrysophaeum taylorii TaxID=2483200 RepID=A0AAD7UQM5_9STRA|nr:hypothetical protein CTAYLR_001150 [Chrysophaeum taylorii]